MESCCCVESAGSPACDSSSEEKVDGGEGIESILQLTWISQDRNCTTVKGQAGSFTMTMWLVLSFCR